jgi:SnoaL-like domain
MSLFPIPAFEHYFAMWNETNPSLIRGHLDLAVTEGFVFCDPLHHHVGRDALEANVRETRSTYPHAAFAPSSGMDMHHDRCRYEWQFTLKGRIVVAGFDAVRIADSGLIDRIDGFFGPLPALAPNA